MEKEIKLQVSRDLVGTDLASGDDAIDMMEYALQQDFKNVTDAVRGAPSLLKEINYRQRVATAFARLVVCKVASRALYADNGMKLQSGMKQIGDKKGEK